ncbi:MAG: hypothetical protein NXI32_28045 [bacterium]|nr:hypothetical protein [bacterium]
MNRFLGRAWLPLMLAGILWGGIALYRDSAAYREVKSVYDRVASEITRFSPGDDPDRIYVRCMVNKPLHLKWQIASPAAAHLIGVRQGLGGSGRATIQGAQEVICRFAVDLGHGQAYQQWQLAGSGSSGGIEWELASFLKRHWDELQISVAGEDETQAFDSLQVIDLLRIEFPSSLLRTAEQELSTPLYQQLQSPVLLCLGISDSPGWQEVSGLNDMTRRFMNGVR